MKMTEEFDEKVNTLSKMKMSIIRNGKYSRPKIEKSFNTKEEAKIFYQKIQSGKILFHHEKYKLTISDSHVVKILNQPHPYEGKIIDHLNIDEELREIFKQFLTTINISRRKERVVAKQKVYEKYREWVGK